MTAPNLNLTNCMNESAIAEIERRVSQLEADPLNPARMLPAHRRRYLAAAARLNELVQAQIKEASHATA